MFIITLSYLQPLEIVEKYLTEHRNFLELGYQKNYFIASGPKNPRTGGIILSHLKTKAELLSIIENDPFYIHKIANYEITEFMPVKYHSQFAHFVEI